MGSQVGTQREEQPEPRPPKRGKSRREIEILLEYTIASNKKLLKQPNVVCVCYHITYIGDIHYYIELLADGPVTGVPETVDGIPVKIIYGCVSRNGCCTDSDLDDP